MVNMRAGLPRLGTVCDEYRLGSLCKTPVMTSLRTITWHVKKGGDTPHQVMGNGFSSR